jgi:hypothetical protein
LLLGTHPHRPSSFRFTKTGSFVVSVTFVQPSSKRLLIDMKCATVTIVHSKAPPTGSCFQEQSFSLQSTNAVNNASAQSRVLLLPYNRQHLIEPVVNTTCRATDLVYSFYVLSIDPSQWKYSRVHRYPTAQEQTFQETFLSTYCYELGPKSTLTFDAASLAHGFYLVVFTLTMATNLPDFRQFIQPIEIIRSDLETTFGGNRTITNDGQSIELDIYSSTLDPDSHERDRRKLNFTLICYPERLQSALFQLEGLQLGASRTTDVNPQNHNPWSIRWSHLHLVMRRPELNMQFFESDCFASETHRDEHKSTVGFDATTKSFNLTEDQLLFDNQTLHFLLIVRHLIDGRQLVTRLVVDKQTSLTFDSTDLSALEEVMNNLDDLAVANPKKAVKLVTDLADKLNEMSDDSVRERERERK